MTNPWEIYEGAPDDWTLVRMAFSPYVMGSVGVSGDKGWAGVGLWRMRRSLLPKHLALCRF